MPEKKKKIRNITIDPHTTLLNALKRMDKYQVKLLIVCDGQKFLSVLSIGDIQRSILANKSLHTPVEEILRRHTRLATIKDSSEKIKAEMLEFRTECMPVLDENNNLADVYFWEDVFPGGKKRIDVNLNLPVVIMAGGKGTRLQPLTNVIPKPLIPLGEKTIIEEIMGRFIESSCTEFHISVNYKAETIKHYFELLQNKSYSLNYFQEDKPLGTVGSLFLLRDKINSTFFISNCDIIVDSDYSDIVKYHRQNENELTIVSALKHYPIPYGTIETGRNGYLKELREKPELTFQINTGMYVLEPHLLNEIPENEFFHITNLIEHIKLRGGKVGVFPVSEGSWKDIGTWSEYMSTISKGE